MGCCSSQLSRQEGDLLTRRVKSCITTGDISQLVLIISQHKKFGLESFEINEFTFQANDNIITSIPGFCILSGSIQVFKYLNEKYYVSIQTLENILSTSGFSGLGIICSKGYSELLSYYMPLSLTIDPIIYQTTRNFVKNIGNHQKNSNFTPVQLACLYGHMSCVKIICEYFNDSEVP